VVAAAGSDAGEGEAVPGNEDVDVAGVDVGVGLGTETIGGIDDGEQKIDCSTDPKP
jgi:hypothetical protein